MGRVILTSFTAMFLMAAQCRAESTAANASGAREQVLGPCEGCEAVFDGLPEALSWHSRIAPQNEPGEPLTIEGTVRDRQGRAAAGVVVYAYQTNAGGIYPPDDGARGRAGRRHGRLRAWARTDARGRYRFDTIRPASYPNTDIPQHVHMHVIEAGCCTYYIDDIVFDDDPHLTPRARRQMTSGRGGSGLVIPRRNAAGWVVTRDIVLGEAIPDYPAARAAQ